MLEPWWLPGLPEGARDWRRGETGAGAPFRTPRLSAAAAGAVAASVREAALRARRELGLGAVVAAVSRAALALADPDDAAGREAVALLGEELGWPERLSRDTLRAMAATWTEGALWAVLHSELSDPHVLDGFRPAPAAGGQGPPAAPSAPTVRSRGGAAPAGGPAVRRRRAAAPPLSLHVHAGNVPGVAVTSVLRGLLARGGVLCKASREEPALLALFARTLAREEPLLGDAVATTWWPGEEAAPAWDVWVKHSGKVIVYGGSSAVEAMRGRCPGRADLVVYGPRTAVGVLLADAAAGAALEDAAGALARDACAYDQRGCLSPRSVFVLGDAWAFAEALADALEREVRRSPPPRPTGADAVALRSLRTSAEFAAYRAPASPAPAGGAEDDRDAGDAADAPGDGPTGPRVLTPGGEAGWTLLVEPAERVAVESVPRVLRIHPLDALERLDPILTPLEGLVQAVGYAGREDLEGLVELAFRLGASRVAPFGRVAWPPADWRHDGKPQILPLLEWTDWEITDATDGSS